MQEDLREAPVAASFTLSLPDQDRGNQFFAEDVAIRVATVAGVRMLLVDAERYSTARDVYTYRDQDEAENHWRKRGTGHWDFHQKNVLLQRAALEFALTVGEAPGVFHCHDGHTAFLPALLHEDPRCAGTLAHSASLVTIHNAGAGYHQEVWDPEFARLLTGLSAESLDKGLLNGAVDPLLLAGFHAPLVTVSEQYARELLEERDTEMSGGLGRALREKGIALAGITNGIDPAPYDPRATRGALPFAFDPSKGNLAGKRSCRQALAERLGAPAAADAAGPLYAFVGRLTGTKGDRCPHRRAGGAGPGGSRATLRGPGPRGEGAGGEAHFPRGRVRHRRQAGLPAALRSFACLAHLWCKRFLPDPVRIRALRAHGFHRPAHGQHPRRSPRGGLYKVRDGETGFSYNEHSPAALAAAVDRTSRLYYDEPDVLERIRRTAFAEVFSLHTWDRVLADSYLPLYESLAKKHARRQGSGDAWTQK